jgi:predicted ATPase
MITRVKLEDYKSLKDSEVNLGQLNVLVGHNASGKSNFLDALQLVSRIANVRSLKDAFEPPYRGMPLESFHFGTEGIKGLLEKHRASFTIEVDVKLPDSVISTVNEEIAALQKSPEKNRGTFGEQADSLSGRKIRVKEDYLRYRVSVSVKPSSGILQLEDEFLAALNQDGSIRKSRNPFLEKHGDHLRLRMEGQAHPRYLDTGINHSILSMGLYAPHYPHMVAMREELSRWLFYYFEPRERMREPTPVREVNHIGMMGEELAAFLKTLQTTDPDQFKNIEKSLSRIVESVEGIEVETNEYGQAELKVIENSTPVPARLVSEGTLRLLGILTLSGKKKPASVLGFEEPENGVTPQRIEMVARFLKTQAENGATQYIITTHSPLLADQMPVDSLYVCQKRKGVSSIKPLSQIEWGPLSHRTTIKEALEENPDRSISKFMLRGDLK